jgi:hypothetical protein
VATTVDALILFEACLSGNLHHVPRRPHDRERSDLIRSGRVFIYEENASGIKRWTDGVPWSPSRILGNFLVYRELIKPFPPGEKKRATKRGKRATKSGEPYPRQSIDSGTGSPFSPVTPVTPGGFRGSDSYDRETERSLIGSLVDSYGFKNDGLVKKTMSVNVNGVHHHLVSYYRVEDVLSGTLTTPSQSSQLRNMKPRHELTSRQNFRAPLNEEDNLDAAFEGHRGSFSYSDRGAFDRRPGFTTPTYGATQPSHSYSYSNVNDMQYGNSAAAYGVAGSSQTAAQSYYTPPGAGPQTSHVKAEDYNSYSSPGGYPPRYEPMNGNMTSTADRAYGPGRSGNSGMEGPAMIDTKMENYKYQYNTAPRTDSASSYHQMDAHRWTGNAASRPEQSPAYSSEKTGYWNPHPSMGHGHAQYSQQPPISQQWNPHHPG